MSTEWLVTAYKGINLVGQPPQYYCLNAPGTFDPATQQPPLPALRPTNCTVAPGCWVQLATSGGNGGGGGAGGFVNIAGVINGNGVNSSAPANVNSNPT